MSEVRVNNLSNESNTGGPSISGITTFSGTNYFVPPVGNTAQRPDNPQKGALRFNTDTKHLEYYRGDGIGWSDIEASNDELNGGHRAFFAGGNDPGACNLIDYVTIYTLGNAQDFGDLNRVAFSGGACSNSTRGLYTAGYGAPSSPSLVNSIAYCTIATLGDFIDFGDATVATRDCTSAASPTRALTSVGGYDNSINQNTIDYVTIATTGNAKDFGDLTDQRNALEGQSNAHGGL